MRAFYTLIVVLHLSFALLFAEKPYSINQNKNNLQGLNFVNENVGWVFNVQEHGTELLKTTDGGNNWFVQKTFDNFTVSLSKLIDEKSGFIAGSRNYFTFELFITYDGGENWTEILLPSVKKINSIHFFNKDIFWISQDGLYKTIDGGKSWHLTHDNSYEFKSLQFFGLMDGWALNKDTLLISTDAGFSWNKTNHKFWKIQLIDGSTGYASKNDSLFRTDNFGASWKFIKNLTYPYYDFKFVTKNVGFNISDEGVLKTTNGGFSWFLYNQDKTEYRYSEFEISHQPGIYTAILLNKSRINITKDDGKTWKNNNIGAFSEILDIKGIDDKKIIVCGYEGLIGRTINGGEIWDFRNDVTYHKLRKIQIINNTVYIQGDSATFLKSTDFGESWQKIMLPNAYIYRDDWLYYPESDGFHFSDENNGWIISKGANAFKTTNGGNDWELVKIPCYDTWDVMFIDKMTGFIIGTTKQNFINQNNEIFKTIDGGKNWEIIQDKYEFARFEYFNHDYLLISGSGTIFKYDINFNTMESIYEGFNVQRIEGFFVLDLNTIWGWSTINTTCTFYKTTNGGKQWNFIDNFCTLPTALYFTDKNNGRMIYGDYNSSILKTNNGGFRSLGKPELLYPLNNSFVPADDIILKFILPDYNGIRIELQIAEDSTFTKLIPNKGNVFTDHFKPENLELYKNYFWRLRTNDSKEMNFSPWSEIWSFEIRWGKNTKVKLLSPLGVETKTLHLGLNWYKLNYADSYRVQLSNDSTFKTIKLDSITSSDNIQKAKFLKVNETYYWRVKAYNSIDSSLWSDTGDFKSLIVSSIYIDDYSEYAIRPNPANDFIMIQTFEVSKVQIFDMLGFEVGQSSLIVNAMKNNSQVGMLDLLRIDITNLPTGVYYIRIGDKVEKFVKK
ncbi:MAG: YCF48-related protein [Candidatus Kapabacteria bacterium]|nr:YCF48-related protein [Candidatus Kapabacteria bacterium]